MTEPVGGSADSALSIRNAFEVPTDIVYLNCASLDHGSGASQRPVKPRWSEWQHPGAFKRRTGFEMPRRCLAVSRDSSEHRRNARPSSLR